MLWVGPIKPWGQSSPACACEAQRSNAAIAGASLPLEGFSRLRATSDGSGWMRGRKGRQCAGNRKSKLNLNRIIIGDCGRLISGRGLPRRYCVRKGSNLHFQDIESVKKKLDICPQILGWIFSYPGNHGLGFGAFFIRSKRIASNCRLGNDPILSGQHRRAFLFSSA